MGGPSYTTAAQSVKLRASAGAVRGAAVVARTNRARWRPLLSPLADLLARLLALLGRHVAPALEISVHALALLGRERLVALEALLDLLLPLGGQPLEAIVVALQLPATVLG